MEYIDVSWLHHNSQYPTRLVSELEGRRYEVRKLEFFANGKVGVASANFATFDTQLGVEPVPSLSQINADPQFKGTSIEASAFEALWQKYARGNT